MEWHFPKNIAHLHSFKGLDGYYHRFIEGLSKVAYPMTSLQKKEKNFKQKKQGKGAPKPQKK